jgi:hypothetical protein
MFVTLPHSTTKIYIHIFDLIEKSMDGKYERGIEGIHTLIIVDVCISVNFLIHRCPGTILQT